MFSNLTLIVIGPVIAHFNPIQLKQPLEKFEWATIEFRPENKSCLTQWVKLKNIFELNPKSNQACVVLA